MPNFFTILYIAGIPLGIVVDTLQFLTLKLRNFKKKKMQTFQKTKQGVRDLNVIRSKKPAGIKLEPLPEDIVIDCKHLRTQEIDDGWILKCCDCNETWDRY